MNKKVVFIIVLVTVLILGGGVWIITKSGTPAYANLDEFAKCLTEKGVVMYGAAWCPHCQAEKRGFGDSFKYVSYVECPDQPALCTEKGVTGYPTWILGDGTRLEGQQGVKKLSQAASCPLPN